MGEDSGPGSPPRPPPPPHLDMEALDKLGFRHLFGQSPVEPVQPNVAFDIASLVLYGCQALPIRLKILLDRLFSVLQRDEVLQVLHGFGWTHEDYARGYILQEPHGGVLDRWNICSPEEEPLVLQQFLRFGETRAITQQLLLAQQELGVTGAGAGAAAAIAAAAAVGSSATGSGLPAHLADSDIKKFIERTAGRVSGPLHPAAPATKPPGPPPPPPPARDRERDRERDRDRERERERDAEGEKSRSSGADFSRHKTQSRASPPSSLHLPPHHPPPLNLGLHPPPPHPPVSHASLPPTRPPPPPPISPLQKNVSLNFLKYAGSNGPITTSSPPSSISSPSPVSGSPLNKLQNMQPFDFRKGSGLPPGLTGGGSPELGHRIGSRRMSEADASPTGLVNLSLTSPTSLCLPPPMPPPPASTASAPSFNHHHPVAAMMSGPLSAASLISSAAGLISSPLSKSPSGVLGGSGGASSEFGSEEDDDEENSHSALNLSRDALMQHHGRPGRPPRHPHLRKASAPVKRGWGGADLPLNLGTQLINPTTGKKRVQCNVCLKTFCDKGALKIHFSAVHLREMHKCTVEGCNMMFSSRRSRNRHSANPNPKLHSPHLRRKISPHDGRTAQSHPLLIPPPGSLSLSAALNPLSFSPFPLLTPPPDLRQAGPPGPHGLPPSLEAAKHSLDLSMQRYEELRRAAIDGANSNTTTSSDDTGALGLNNHHTDDDDAYDDDEEGIVVDGGADDDDDDDVVAQDLTDKDDDGVAGVKRVKLSESDMDEEMVSNLDSNEDSLSVVDTHSVKEENGVESTASASSKSVRKRKNQNPTRCAVPAIMEPNVMSDDDSSNDVVFTAAPAAEENAQDIPSNSTDPKNEQGEVAGATIKKEAQDEPEESGEPKSSSEVNMKMEVDAEDEKESAPDADNENPPKEEEMSKMEETSEEQEMMQEEQEEPLSLAAEDKKLKSEPVTETEASTGEKGSPNASPRAESRDAAGDSSVRVKRERSDADEEAEEEKSARALSSAGSHHSEESLDSSHALRHLENLTHGPFGDLLLARAGQAASPLTTQHPFPGLPYMMGGPPSPARSQGSSGASNGPDSPSDDQGMYFHDSGFMSNLDVPIDKDNPRRCTACGKIFQNHFGVKTHFQNVHLKLMHKCTVEGCNAAFPSKRSRDRHSANLNLHRKLLSTSSSDKAGAGLFMDKSPFASLAANPALHSDFLARLYAESQALPLNLDAFKGLPPPHLAPPPGSLAEQMMLNGDRLPPPHPSLLLPPLGGLPGFPGLNNFASHLGPAAALAGVNGKERRSPGSASPASPRSPAVSVDRRSASPPPVFAADEEPAPAPDPDTGLLTCSFCRRPLVDAGALRDHYERDHRGDLFVCSVPGCSKAFTTRERRNAHSDNASLHVGTPALAPPPADS